MSRDTLLDLLERCDSAMNRRFHRDGLGGLMEAGGTINVYMHEGYAVNIADVTGYYEASMDMLDAKNRRELFPEDRPVHTNIGPGATLNYIISDKDVTVDGGVTLAGSPKLPLVVPKGSKI